MAVGATLPMPPVDFDDAKVVAATAIVGLVLAVWLLLAICAARYKGLIRSNAFDIDGDARQLPHMRMCSTRARCADVRARRAQHTLVNHLPHSPRAQRLSSSTHSTSAALRRPPNRSRSRRAPAAPAERRALIRAARTHPDGCHP